MGEDRYNGAKVGNLHRYDSHLEMRLRHLMLTGIIRLLRNILDWILEITTRSHLGGLRYIELAVYPQLPMLVQLHFLVSLSQLTGKPIPSRIPNPQHLSSYGISLFELQPHCAIDIGLFYAAEVIVR